MTIAGDILDMAVKVSLNREEIDIVLIKFGRGILKAKNIYEVVGTKFGGNVISN